MSPHTYERIQLSCPTSGFAKTANAVLLAVRELHWIDQNTKDYDVMVGYIVPEFDEETGKVDFTNKVDGFYPSNWSNQEIVDFGFQGKDGRRKITGWSSQTEAELVGYEVSPAHHFNGHMTGTLQNRTANTTHLILSPDSHRYIQDNFGKQSINILRATGKETIIKIVTGPGAGHQGIANGIVAYEDGCPVIELRMDSQSKSTGFPPQRPVGTWRSGHAYGTPSTYSLGMVPIDVAQTAHANNVNQIGRAHVGNYARTNNYGERYGIYHLPGGKWFEENRTAQWTAGEKLIEFTNHGSNLPWFQDSYASGKYHARGTMVDTVGSNGKRLEILKELRSKLSGFEIDDLPMNNSEQVYVPARNNDTNMDGKLAVVTKVTLVNGTYTGLSEYDVPYVEGDAKYGEVVEISADQMSSVETGKNAQVIKVDSDAATENLPHTTG
jgi:hypothetical protein